LAPFLYAQPTAPKDIISKYIIHEITITTKPFSLSWGRLEMKLTRELKHIDKIKMKKGKKKDNKKLNTKRAKRQ
jgi:nitrogen fixation/metabolism regulation signal transduction histidine kinase